MKFDSKVRTQINNFNRVLDEINIFNQVPSSYHYVKANEAMPQLQMDAAGKVTFVQPAAPSLAEQKVYATIRDAISPSHRITYDAIYHPNEQAV